MQIYRFRWSIAPFRFKFVAVVVNVKEDFSMPFPDTSTGALSPMRRVQRLDGTRSQLTNALPIAVFHSIEKHSSFLQEPT